MFKLDHYYTNSEYKKTANQMLTNLKNEVLETPSGYSNWLQLMLNYSRPFFEVAITGKNVDSIKKEILGYYIPNIIIAGSKKENNSIPLLENKFIEDETFIYVCNLGTCKLPQKNLIEAVQLISK
ncbi:hypothetical protein [uncultured Polaribacter sp.]|uniref:hypothetical protein n=1 Tax=uncultured Polaribacter sp. TaxID=174711 RepID=UPI0030D864A8|tara:strand:- start:205 stop:579 length:375 start_codon:yes stop_codon:yes gene_type:complete